MRDPYTVLGVSKQASQDDIKKAYRRLVKELHPDRNPGDAKTEQRFKEVSAAYGIVGDAAKRKKFDRGEIDADGRERPDAAFHRAYAEAGRARDAGAGGFGGFGGAGQQRAGGGFSGRDFFEEFFGRGTGTGSGGAGVRAKGTDVAYELEVDFVDAARGTKKPITLSDGRTLGVTVPAGTEDGTTLRLKGQGLKGLGGGTPGDALVEVRVRPHPHFRREGLDIHLTLPVTLAEAVEGASVAVPTVDGKVQLKVPAGSNTGTVLRLRGRGIEDAKAGKRGDQRVRLEVHLPDPQDPDLVAFARGWKPAKGRDPRAKAGL
ncbi:MAG: DnaJ C-terminal domain-containing protein [Azospirillaceae bacterium]